MTDIEKLLRKLSWYENREPMVRILVGAIEDTMSLEWWPEWRALVDWEASADDKGDLK
jgi:hypothetical protein